MPNFLRLSNRKKTDPQYSYYRTVSQHSRNLISKKLSKNEYLSTLDVIVNNSSIYSTDFKSLWKSALEIIKSSKIQDNRSLRFLQKILSSGICDETSIIKEIVFLKIINNDLRDAQSTLESYLSNPKYYKESELHGYNGILILALREAYLYRNSISEQSASPKSNGFPISKNNSNQTPTNSNSRLNKNSTTNSQISTRSNYRAKSENRDYLDILPSSQNHNDFDHIPTKTNSVDIPEKNGTNKLKNKLERIINKIITCQLEENQLLILTKQSQPTNSLNISNISESSNHNAYSNRNLHGKEYNSSSDDEHNNGSFIGSYSQSSQHPKRSRLASQQHVYERYNLESARKHLLEAVRLNPSGTLFQYYLVQIYIAMDDLNMAEKALDELFPFSDINSTLDTSTENNSNIFDNIPNNKTVYIKIAIDIQRIALQNLNTKLKVAYSLKLKNLNPNESSVANKKNLESNFGMKKSLDFNHIVRTAITDDINRMPNKYNILLDDGIGDQIKDEIRSRREKLYSLYKVYLTIDPLSDFKNYVIPYMDLVVNSLDTKKLIKVCSMLAKRIDFGDHENGMLWTYLQFFMEKINFIYNSKMFYTVNNNRYFIKLATNNDDTEAISKIEKKNHGYRKLQKNKNKKGSSVISISDYSSFSDTSFDDSENSDCLIINDEFDSDDQDNSEQIFYIDENEKYLWKYRANWYKTCFRNLYQLSLDFSYPAIIAEATKKNVSTSVIDVFNQTEKIDYNEFSKIICLKIIFSYAKTNN
ncbi:hypothetical protein BB558_000748 [Smittium angustum]|uniref:Uncharacterized protein n=1 Tax=Smittium angustum TaxID=133377 RepID=A0A2U1J512_SMIAN|nr:hypothetical protein BB558_003825 [Smittium angustum]PWA03089.1 hypothetical protein BB558_000748 [Smittium angustum]